MTRVIVAGALANKPGNGGEAWVRTNWFRGLQRLGLDVWFVEQLAPGDWGGAETRCIDWFERTARRFGLSDRGLLVDPHGNVLAGRGATRDGLLEGADLLVNISGHLRGGPMFERCRRRAYVDLDPAYTQVWHAHGADLGLGDHDTHFSVGLSLGRPDCGVPLGETTWHAVFPPVLLDEWTPCSGGDLDRFTTVASWRGGYGTLEHDGIRYGAKAHEFRRFVDLPAHVDAELEIALQIDAADQADRLMLVDHGWKLVDIAVAVGDPDRFRSYVRASPAELSVAQGAYVHMRTGWFSDRTAHYLAAGRPALVQDTGVPLPAGEGLVLFTTTEDAVSGAKRLRDRYDEHRAAARRFAEEHLDATRVLERFLDQTGVRG